MNKSKRHLIANQTLEILKTGKYWFKDRQIDLSNDLSRCYDYTYSSPYNENIEIEIEKHYEKTIFTVEEETTLNGIEYANKKYSQIGVLNFASAKNPGGGFLKGSQAQEESLARSSGLYNSLILCRDYYEYHRHQGNLLYSDYMIVSPNVPFFRTDEGELQENPILCTVFTSPAVNKGAIKNQKIYPQIYPTMIKRTKKLLSLAYQEKVEILILGAWGCGVFQNNPKEIANIFYEVIMADFMGAFQEIRFSILDKTQGKTTLKPFQDYFLAMNH